MAGALKCNGIPLPSKGLVEVPEWGGDLAGRGADGTFDENVSFRKRMFTATIVPQTAALGVAFRRLLEGEGQAWRFDSNLFSFKGEGPGAGGSYAQSNTGGVLSGGKINVGSGSFFPVSLGSSMGVEGGWRAFQGWSLICRKVLTAPDGGDGTTFHRLIATGAVAVTAGTANPVGVSQYMDGAAGSFSMGAWITVDGAGDGVCKLHGLSNAGGSAAYDYCDFAVLPFQLDSTWIQFADAFMQQSRWSRLKRIVLGGSQIEDLTPGVECHARATRIPRAVRAPAGVHDASYRGIDFNVWTA